MSQEDALLNLKEKNAKYQELDENNYFEKTIVERLKSLKKKIC